MECPHCCQEISEAALYYAMVDRNKEKFEIECHHCDKPFLVDAEKDWVYTLRRIDGHECKDWDYLFIRPGDPEMDACTCSERVREGYEGPEFKRKAK